MLAAVAALSVVLTSPVARADHSASGDIEAPATGHCYGETVAWWDWDGSSSFLRWEVWALCDFVIDGRAEVVSVPLEISGTAQQSGPEGYCALATGSGAGTLGSVHLEDADATIHTPSNRTLVMTFDHDAQPGGAGTAVFDTMFSGTYSGCFDDGGFGFYFDGMIHLAASDVEEMAELVDLEDPAFRQSDECRLSGGDRVVDSTVLGVRQAVWVHQPTADQLWICARVEDDTGEGYGGRLEVRPTGLDPQVTGGVAAPELDGASTACTTTKPNDAPGTRPIAFGGVGPVDYMLDAFLDGDEAWLCLQVGDTDTRVVVPLGGDTPGVSFGPVATWWPDEGTPTL